MNTAKTSSPSAMQLVLFLLVVFLAYRWYTDTQGIERYHDIPDVAPARPSSTAASPRPRLAAAARKTVAKTATGKRTATAETRAKTVQFSGDDDEVAQDIKFITAAMNQTPITDSKDLLPKFDPDGFYTDEKRKGCNFVLEPNLDDALARPLPQAPSTYRNHDMQMRPNVVVDLDPTLTPWNTSTIDPQLTSFFEEC